MNLDDPLARPIWAALTTRQAGLARGDRRALRFDPDFGPFAAAADSSPESLAALGALIPEGGAVVVVQADATPTPPGARVVQDGPLNQMIATELAPSAAAFEIVDLTEDDAPQMLALATLTQPGPFVSRTHQLGDFVGVKVDGQLVAMAGERMKLVGFTEVSGVCTLPEHRGKGYAAGLTSVAAARILARGETPILHVFPNNIGAIAVYEALGFTLRRSLSLTVFAHAREPV